MHNNSGINKVFLVGYVETTHRRHYNNSKPDNFCFTLTTSEIVYKGVSSFEHVEHHHIVVNANHPDINGFELEKGSLLHIIGKLQTRTLVDKDNIKRYKTEVLVLQLSFLKPAVISTYQHP
jgi:single-stranded DNA-binding protein